MGAARKCDLTMTSGTGNCEHTKVDLVGASHKRGRGFYIMSAVRSALVRPLALEVMHMLQMAQGYTKSRVWGTAATAMHVRGGVSTPLPPPTRWSIHLTSFFSTFLHYIHPAWPSNESLRGSSGQVQRAAFQKMCLKQHPC